MKKRALSLLMAFCLMLTLAPAAFATESEADTITLPNGEVREILSLEDIASEPMALAETDSTGLQVENGVIRITSVADFVELSQNQDLCLSGYDLELDVEGKVLDLSSVSCTEWDGYLHYFYGDINGNNHVIKGLKDNRGLVYGYFGGTVKDLTFELDGAAAFLLFMPTSNTDRIYMDNIKTEGFVTLTGADQSNYSPFIFCSGYGGLTMTNCVNNAEISGDIYGSIFYGYYPLYTTEHGEQITYVFDGCVNNANVVMRNASMFFGNPSTINSKLSAGTLDVTIENCENNAVIRGTVSSHYFAPSLNSAEYSSSDAELIAMEESLTEADEVTGKAPVTVPENCGLAVGNALENFTYSINEENQITFNAPESEIAIAKYVVSVGSYVKWWDTVAQKFDGSGDRYTVSQEITATSADSYTSALKVLGFADSDFGNAGTRVNGLRTRTDGTNTYYQIIKYSDTNLYLGRYQRYATNAVDENGLPGGGCVEPQFITVAALDSNGAVIDFAVFSN